MAGPPHPRFLSSEPEQPEFIDQHLSEVTEACQRVASGDWELDQFAEYIEAQLKAFRDDARANDPNRMMRMVAIKMTDAEIKAVSDYIAGLR